MLGGLQYFAERRNRNGFIDVFRGRGYSEVMPDLLGQGWTTLNEQAKDIRKHGRVMAPLRYEAKDQAAALDDVFTQLEKQGRLNQKVTVVSVSYGGWLSAYLATRPEFRSRIKKIVLLD